LTKERTAGTLILSEARASHGLVGMRRILGPKSLGSPGNVTETEVKLNERVYLKEIEN